MMGCPHGPSWRALKAGLWRAFEWHALSGGLLSGGLLSGRPEWWAGVASVVGPSGGSEWQV